MRTIPGPLFTLRPYERGIQETLGKYSGFVMSGLGFQFPFVHITRIRDVREHTMDIEPQPLSPKTMLKFWSMALCGYVLLWMKKALISLSINIDSWKRQSFS